MGETAREPEWLSGLNEAAPHLVARDWSSTSLGTLQDWPPNLRTAVGIMLGASWPAGIFWGTDLVFLYNDALRKVIGVRDPQALGRSAQEEFHDAWSCLGPMVAQVMSTGRAADAKEALVRLEEAGRTVDHYFDFTLSPIFDGEGGVAGLFAAVVEATEKVQAAEALQVSEARLRAALAGARAGFWQVVLEPRSTYWDSGWRRIYGFTPDEPATDAKWRSRVHPDDLQRIEQNLQGALAGATEKWEQEFRILHPSLGTRWIHDRGTVERDETGLAVSIGGLNFDVTEKKTAEDALHASEMRMRLAIEAAALGEIDVDYANDRVVTSPRFREIAGLSGDGPRTVEELRALYHPDDRAWVSARIEDALRRGQSRLGLEFRIVRPDGSVAWIELLGGRKPATEETGAQVVAVVRDITARKKEEMRLRSFIDQAPAAIAMLDRDLHYLAASRRWLEDYGLAQQSLVGRSHYEVFPDIPERWRVAHQRCLSGETIAADEDRYDRDSHTAWLRWECRPWYSFDGSVGGILLFTEDITKRKLAEVAVRESEERFRVLFEGMVPPLLIIDPGAGGTILDANPAAAAFYGWSREELRRMRIGEINNLPAAEVAAVMARARSGENSHFEFHHRLADGSVREVEVYSGPVSYGGRAALYSIVHDVTDRRLAEVALRESEERFRTLFGSSPVAMAITCLADNRVADGNEAFFEMIGFSRDEVIGKRTVELGLWPDSAQRADLTDTITREGGIDSVEVTLRRRDNTALTVLASGQRITLKGRPHMVTTALDITVRKEAEERQRLLMREVDHRAKNALAVVQAVVRLTRANSIERFTEAVEGRVAALARAHSLLAKSHWRGAALRALIGEELAPYLGGESSRGVLSGPGLDVRAEAVQSLAMVFHELATNAAKYGALSDPRGRVSVSWEWRDSGELGFLWKEEGGPKVLAPARQGFGSTMILRTITGHLGGSIEVSWPTDGMRCEFTMAETWIEGHSSQRPPRSSEAPAEAPASVLRGCRILVLEDEPLLAINIIEDLRQFGCTPIGPAATVDEGLRLLAVEPRLDAALVDINLRGEEAWPALEVLEARGVPCVLATGYGDLAGKPGAARVLQKPFSAEKMASALLQAMHRER